MAKRRRSDSSLTLLLVGGGVLLAAMASAGKTVVMEERFEEKTETGVTHTIVKILSIPAAMGSAALTWFAAKPIPSPYGQPQLWTSDPNWGNNDL